MAIHLHEGKVQGMILYGDHIVERRLDQDSPQPRLAHQPLNAGIASAEANSPT